MKCRVSNVKESFGEFDVDMNITLAKQAKTLYAIFTDPTIKRFIVEQGCDFTCVAQTLKRQYPASDSSESKRNLNVKLVTV